MMLRRFLLTMLLGSFLALGAGCGPSLVSKVRMRCGENQVHTIARDRCVIITAADGDCPVKATAKCEGEAETSTTVRPGGEPGKLCCKHAIGPVRFDAAGEGKGECKFTYGRD
jgi:hypothetical protein